MKSHDAWTMEELWQQAQRNFSGHMAIIFLFLQEKGLSVDEFVDYTAIKTSKRWKAVVKNIPDMMNSILLNVLSNGEKILEVKISDTMATAVVSGLLRSDLIANYSCPAEAADSFWNKFCYIAEDANAKFSWRKSEDGNFHLRLTKP